MRALASTKTHLDCPTKIHPQIPTREDCAKKCCCLSKWCTARIAGPDRNH